MRRDSSSAGSRCPSRFRLVPIPSKKIFYFLFLHLQQEDPGRQATLRIHSQVQRDVVLPREAARRVVELHGRDAEVGEDQVGAVRAPSLLPRGASAGPRSCASRSARPRRRPATPRAPRVALRPSAARSGRRPAREAGRPAGFFRGSRTRGRRSRVSRPRPTSPGLGASASSTSATRTATWLPAGVLPEASTFARSSGKRAGSRSLYFSAKAPRMRAAIARTPPRLSGVRRRRPSPRQRERLPERRRQRHTEPLAHGRGEVVRGGGRLRRARLHARAPEDERHVDVVLVMGAVHRAAARVVRRLDAPARDEDDVARALRVEVVPHERERRRLGPRGGLRRRGARPRPPRPRPSSRDRAGRGRRRRESRSAPRVRRRRRRSSRGTRRGCRRGSSRPCRRPASTARSRQSASSSIRFSRSLKLSRVSLADVDPAARSRLVDRLRDLGHDRKAVVRRERDEDAVLRIARLERVEKAADLQVEAAQGVELFLGLVAVVVRYRIVAGKGEAQKVGHVAAAERHGGIVQDGEREVRRELVDERDSGRCLRSSRGLSGRAARRIVKGRGRTRDRARGTGSAERWRRARESEAASLRERARAPAASSRRGRNGPGASVPAFVSLNSSRTARRTRKADRTPADDMKRPVLAVVPVDAVRAILPGKEDGAAVLRGEGDDARSRVRLHEVVAERGDAQVSGTRNRPCARRPDLPGPCSTRYGASRRRPLRTRRSSRCR